MNDSNNVYGVYVVKGQLKVGPTRASDETALDAAAREKGNRRAITLIHAENKADARAQFEALSAKVVPKPKRKTVPKAPVADGLQPMTSQEIQAAVDSIIEAGNFPFLMSRTGMAYHPRYTVKNGVYDILALDTPNLGDIGADAWVDGLTGSIRHRPLTGLHCYSCTIAA